MKRLTKIFCSLLFVISLLGQQESVAQSQKIEITVGKPYSVVDAPLKYYYAEGNEILSVKIDKRTITLQKFDSDRLTFLKTKIYDDFGKEFVMEYITEIRGHYYLFYSMLDGGNEQLFAREINFKEGSFVGQGVKLFSVNKKIASNLGPNGFYHLRTLDKFLFTVSDDSSKLLILYRVPPDAKPDSKDPGLIGVNVFDFSLKELWRKEFSMPYEPMSIVGFDFTTDKNGNAYIIAKVFKGEHTAKRLDIPDYTIELFKMSADTKNLTIHPITIPEKYLRTLRLHETAKGELIAAGYYNNNKKNIENVDGVFVINISKDTKVSKVSLHEIPLSILNENVSNKQERKNERKEAHDKAEFEEMSLAEVHVESDGSVLLVGEQYFMRTNYNHAPTGGPTMTYSFHYNDLLVTKIKPDGSLAWMKKIAKRQQGSKGRGAMSFRYFTDKDDYYFVFLDNNKNLELSKDEIPAQHIDGIGGFLALHKITGKTGEVSKSLVFDIHDVKGMEIFQFAPSRIVGTGRLEFVFEAYKKKKEDVLVKVQL